MYQRDEIDYGILDRYIRYALSSPTSVFNPRGSIYRFRCNVCGDSKRMKRKKRAYILKQKHPWRFFCHNCHKSMTAVQWLRRYFPSYFRDYIRDTMQSTMTTVESSPQVVVPETIVESVPATRVADADDCKSFVPILHDNEWCRKAQAMCIRRAIPEDVWHKWFVALDGKYRHRMIIPFFNATGQITYWQGRTLEDDNSVKYMNRSINKDQAIYGIHSIDKSRPVVVVEGPIDSLFIENAVAVLGNSSAAIDEQLATLNCVYMFDYDKAGQKAAQKKLQQSSPVFIWKIAAKQWQLPQREKWDINDLFLHLNRKTLFTYAELKPFVSSHYWDTMWMV